MGSWKDNIKQPVNAISRSFTMRPVEAAAYVEKMEQKGFDVDVSEGFYFASIGVAKYTFVLTRSKKLLEVCSG